MRTLLFAAVGASVLLGAGVASAQGLPPGLQAPDYGATWTANRLSLRAPDANAPLTAHAKAGDASDRVAGRNVHATSTAARGG